MPSIPAALTLATLIATTPMSVSADSFINNMTSRAGLPRCPAIIGMAAACGFDKVADQLADACSAYWRRIYHLDEFDLSRPIQKQSFDDIHGMYAKNFQEGVEWVEGGTIECPTVQRVATAQLTALRKALRD